MNNATLMLLIGSASAQAFGPMPSINMATADAEMLGFSSGDINTATETTSTDVVLGWNNANNYKSGAYQCLMSGMSVLPTQAFTEGNASNKDGSFNRTDIDTVGYTLTSQATTRSFYATDTAQQGAQPIFFNGGFTGGAINVNDANYANSVSWFFGIDEDDDTNMLLIFNAGTQTVWECCVVDQSSQVDFTGSNDDCMSLAPIVIIKANDDAVTDLKTDSDGSGAYTRALMDNRLVISNDWNPSYKQFQSEGANDGTTNANIDVDADLLWASLAQQSDNLNGGNWDSTSGVNYCTLHRTELDTASKTGQHEMNEAATARTKCSWIVWGTDKMPQISLTTSTTQFNYNLQWIEWSTEFQVTGMMFESDGTGYTGQIHGPTDAGMAKLLNPMAITANSSLQAKGYPDVAAFGTSWTKTVINDHVAGSVGMWETYSTAEANSDAWAGEIDSGVVIAALAPGFTLYDGYETEVNSYNELAETYNEAVGEYNEEVEAQELDKPTTAVPTRPCVGEELSAWSGFQVDTRSQADFGNDGQKTTGGFYARPKTDDGTAARRMGWLGTQLLWQLGTEEPADETANALDFTVAHVFGRLGQGEANKPGVSAWIWNSANSAEYNLQVSVLPENGEFVFASGEKITIDYSVASSNLDIASLNPSAPSVSITELDDLLGAKALAATGAAILALSTLF